jgi:hypothetical protein
LRLPCVPYRHLYRVRGEGERDRKRVRA